jgi:formate hydrogenlyase subunit 6/NADH:ubiquinone oxidoreductase subunit I
MSLEVKKKIVRKKAQVIRDSCVACGTCANVCPIEAIKIVAGVFAEVDQTKCVGCTKCANECPASVIDMITKEEVK